LNLNWVTTLRTSRLMATRRGRVEQLDVELSWVGLLRYERDFKIHPFAQKAPWRDFHQIWNKRSSGRHNQSWQL